MTRASELEVLGVRARLGESPVWDARADALWCVDIEARAIVRFSPSDGSERRWPVPDKPGCIALCERGGPIVAMSGGLHRFDPSTGRLEHFVDVETDRPGNRLNDGKVAPDGALWVGSMDDTPARRASGALYRVTADGKVEKKRDGIAVSNGLAWSADGATLFHADTRAPCIRRYRHEPGGRIDDGVEIARPDEATGRPDGAATDADGNYWSAGVSARCINVWSPDGKLLERIDLPVPNPTMPCFAGEDMRTVYVTSLVRGEHPNAGAVVRLRSSVAGVAVGLFAI